MKSRVESILGASRNPDRNAGSSDVLEIAKRFNCNIWSLNKTLTWLNKFKSKYGSLSSSVPKPVQKHKERLLREPFIKLDSSLKYARPAFSEFKVWPSVSFEGWAGSSPFSDQRRRQGRKSLGTRLDLDAKKDEAAGKRKECVRKKEGGFCEICNKSYSELERHLVGDLHSSFVRDGSNWTELDCKVDADIEAARQILF